MTVYYKVWHRMNPNGAITLAFNEEQTPMIVKDKACRERFFPWSEYTKLRVRKTKVQSNLKQYSEVQANG